MVNKFVCGLVMIAVLYTPVICLADTFKATFTLFEAGSIISTKEKVKDLQAHNKIIKTESVTFNTNQKVKFEADNEYAVEIRVLKMKSDGSKLVNVELVRTAPVDIKSKEDDSVELHLPKGRFVNSDRLVIENNQAISVILNKYPALIEITKLVDVTDTK
ncbi:TPA: hypothetical protein L6I57_004120 [Salmonella enterica subsp. enterica serovar Infantis]|nr:hypothetical protein [Salmonella enterica subsp. enterica serovar Infantis]HBP8226476.1 hypothetical protein [Salmonella enterica subsp. enterica serovar Infantis]